MAAYLTYEEAIGQLQRGPEEDRAKVEASMAIASALVEEYLGPKADPLWDPLTVPLHVKQAAQLTLSHVYFHRGEDMRLDEAFTEAIARVLMRTRDQVIA